MATIDYEKKYKEALNRAKNTIEVNQAVPDIVDCVESLFPELAESRTDERIRKALIWHLTRVDNEIPLGAYHSIDGIEIKDMLAWLEKQGEQKDILKDVILDSNEDGLIAETIKVGKAKKSQRIVSAEAKEEMYDKPAWSEEDENILRLSLENLTELKDRFGEGYGKVGECISWLKSLKDRVQPQPKQEWSEEDDIMKQHCHQMLALLRPNTSELTKDIIDNCHHWLKSIKSRVQPKIEWSERDELMLEASIGFIKSSPYPYSGDTFRGEISKIEVENWLKSLKGRYTWKPSDEQMEAIRIAAEVGTANDSWAMNILKSMYQDLKKLREE